jgi:clan AA aspartic protease
VSTLTIRATLIHPEHRERSVEIDLLVDTGATYMLLPPDVVDRLRLETSIERRVMLASGERVVYRLGDVRIRLGAEEHTTTFLAGSAGCRALFGAFGLELFGLAVDPVHHRLIPAPPALL